ncbi:PilZ domain-containing protein [Jeongeupia naejangsanensis]|uniref:PilZ domain-containing protein n=1 Tax=Jeongeupia naejangsanensis TaxID=613195 RepID=UPI0027E4A9CF|nr:PilZ domain-containing protein [Jeongeupia naejangsanensis]
MRRGYNPGFEFRSKAMSAFPEGVHFDAVLPLVWQPQVSWQPFEVARYLDVLADFDTAERAEAVTGEQAKLDLQLLWLARLMNPSLPLPAPVTIGLEYVRWSANDVALGAKGCLAMVPDEALPHLLSLPVEVIAVEPDGMETVVTARWQLDHAAARDAFERYVFRCHREQIRQERGTKP